MLINLLNVLHLILIPLFIFVLGKLSYLTWYTAAPSFHNPYALEARFDFFLM